MCFGESRMDIVTSFKQTSAANFSFRVLAEVLDELVDQIMIPFDRESKIDKVKDSLRNISSLYRIGLSYASSLFRSDWDDPVNRCAYVFLYLAQHCHLVYFALDESRLDILPSWRYKNKLKVCSIGGGPGSDLVGLTSFLRENRPSPFSLECLVLDLHTKWKKTWKVIYNRIPEAFQVTYRRCDLVRDTSLLPDERRFIQEADIITLVKSFSAVSAFFRADSDRGDFLREILRDTKPGCFVLYIDNEGGGDTQFERQFASSVGLNELSQFRGKAPVPSVPYPYTVARYCRLFDFNPMRSCNVNIQLFCNGAPATLRKPISSWPSTSGFSRRQVPIIVGESSPPQKRNTFLHNIFTCCKYCIYIVLFCIVVLIYNAVFG